jgi:hypothetical protein
MNLGVGLVRRLYLIPGMGVDGRLFERQRGLPLDVRVIEWIEPRGEEGFSEYAQQMAEGIDTTEPFIWAACRSAGWRRWRSRGT